MIKDIIVCIIQFIILLLCQVLILNNVYFLGFINPMIYIWFILMLPFATPKWLVLIISFVMGIMVDILSNDVGVNVFTCVFIGFLRPIILNIFSGNIDNNSFLRPCAASLGFKNFLFYIMTLVAIHHLLYFTIEIFSFQEIIQILLRTVLSSLVTILSIVLLDMICFRKSQ